MGSLSNIKDQLTIAKDFFAASQSLVTIFAIIIGGIWTYALFIRTRQRYPRLKITHQISCQAINSKKLILSINIIISNIGPRLIPIESVLIRLSQIPSLDVLSGIPIGNQVPIWDEIVQYKPDLTQFEYRIEPGEEQQFLFHFVIGKTTPTVLVETFFPNVESKKAHLSWGLATLYNLEGSN